jgi:hypothetical protein
VSLKTSIGAKRRKKPFYTTPMIIWREASKKDLRESTILFVEVGRKDNSKTKALQIIDLQGFVQFVGGGSGIRTHDLLHAMQAL